MAELYNDSLTEKGANRLAERIKGHWRVRGHDVKVWTEIMDKSLGADQVASGHAVYVVRSDMINGLPRTMVDGVRHYNKVIHNV